MTVWYKQGVCGDLTNKCRKALGKVAKHAGGDLYITSIRDGNHMPGSLHYDGNAFDVSKGWFSKKSLKKVLGKDFDVVEHSTHFHIEYDPK
jgi:hypothetical protein